MWWSIIVQNKHNCAGFFSPFFFLTISKRSGMFTLTFPIFCDWFTVCRSEILPILEEWIKNHVSKMNIHRSVRPGTMNPRMLKVCGFLNSCGITFYDFQKFLVTEKGSNLVYEDLMVNNVQSTTKVQLENIHCIFFIYKDSHRIIES